MPAHDREDTPPARSRSGGCAPLLAAVVVAAVVSAAVTLALNFILVPEGVGWRKLTHEGMVTIPGGQPVTVPYPSAFAKPPNLYLEAQGNDIWFYEINQQTAESFTITNTTVNRNTGTPMFLNLKWKAEGTRW